jgi:hypothetical protein
MIKTVRSAHFAVLHIGMYSVLIFTYSRYKHIINSRSLLVHISINITADLEITYITQHSGKTCLYFRSHRSTRSPCFASSHIVRSYPGCKMPGALRWLQVDMVEGGGMLTFSRLMTCIYVVPHR